jgi:hypothetical protein
LTLFLSKNKVRDFPEITKKNPLCCHPDVPFLFFVCSKLHIQQTDDDKPKNHSQKERKKKEHTHTHTDIDKTDIAMKFMNVRVIVIAILALSFLTLTAVHDSVIVHCHAAAEEVFVGSFGESSQGVLAPARGSSYSSDGANFAELLSRLRGDIRPGSPLRTLVLLEEGVSVATHTSTMSYASAKSTLKSSCIKDKSKCPPKTKCCADAEGCLSVCDHLDGKCCEGTNFCCRVSHKCSGKGNNVKCVRRLPGNKEDVEKPDKEIKIKDKVEEEKEEEAREDKEAAAAAKEEEDAEKQAEEDQNKSEEQIQEEALQEAEKEQIKEDHEVEVAEKEDDERDQKAEEEADAKTEAELSKNEEQVDMKAEDKEMKKMEDDINDQEETEPSGPHVVIDNGKTKAGEPVERLHLPNGETINLVSHTIINTGKVGKGQGEMPSVTVNSVSNKEREAASEKAAADAEKAADEAGSEADSIEA